MPSINVSTRALVVGLKAPQGGGKSAAAISEATGIPARTINHIYTRAVKRGWDPNAWPLELKDEYLADAPRSGRPPKHPREEGQPAPRSKQRARRKAKVGGVAVPEHSYRPVAADEVVAHGQAGCEYVGVPVGERLAVEERPAMEQRPVLEQRPGMEEEGREVKEEADEV